MGIEPEPSVEAEGGNAFPRSAASHRSTMFDAENSTTTVSWTLSPPISRPYYY